MSAPPRSIDDQFRPAYVARLHRPRGGVWRQGGVAAPPVWNAFHRGRGVAELRAAAVTPAATRHGRPETGISWRSRRVTAAAVQLELRDVAIVLHLSGDIERSDHAHGLSSRQGLRRISLSGISE